MAIYEGDEAYIFVSYSHKDKEAVESIIEDLQQLGFRIWYDPGIEPGSEWPEYIAEHIDRCRVFLAFVSPNSVESSNCRQEIHRAINQNKDTLIAYLEETELSPGMDMRLSPLQAVFRDRFESDDEFVRSLSTAKKLQVCKDGAEEADGEVSAPMSEKPAKSFGQKPAREKADAGKTGSFNMKYLVIGLCALLAIGIGVFTFSGMGSKSGVSATKAAAYAYASEIRGYVKAGSTSSYTELSNKVNNALETNKAFSIISFIRNESASAARVESVKTQVLTVDPIKDPIMTADANLNGETLLIYAGNDGWGDSPLLTMEFYTTVGTSTERIAFDDFCTAYDLTAESTVYKPGDVRKIAALDIDVEKLRQYPNATDGSRLTVHAVAKETGKELGVWPLAYVDGIGLQIAYGGIGGGGEYEVTLFGILDVDKGPGEIIYNGSEASPRVEDTFRIETVIAPTKSCHVVCKNVYSVNGSLQETPEYEATVTVPVFKAQGSMNVSVFWHSGALTRELSANPNASQYEIDRIADTYRYDPQSIAEEAKNAQ